MVGNKKKFDEIKENKGVEDAFRDIKRGIKTVRKLVKWVIKGILALPLLIKVLLILAVIWGVVTLITGLTSLLEEEAVEDMIGSIYDELGISDVIELVELTGDPNGGYYWQFKSGVEDKLEEIVDKQKETNPSIIMEDASTLMKFMKADVETRLPNLGSPTGIGKASSTRTGSLCWPTDGTTITSYFGPRQAPVAGASTNHGAIDIGVPEGTNVYACQSGTITIADFSDSAGNWIVIDHGSGYKTTYMHNRELKVSPGDTVSKGQVIALSGNTGNSSGPHLHFQIEYNGQKQDPLSFQYDNGQGSGNKGFGENVGADIRVSQLDKFLFIGDSITVGLGKSGQIEGKNCQFVAQVGIGTKKWINDYFDTLKKGDPINGICIMLGVNSVTEYDDEIQLVKKLHQKYPDKPIFVQKLLPINKIKYSGGVTNASIQTYNQKIEDFCRTEGSTYNAKFIDTTSGLVDSSGNLDLNYSGDGLHPNANGYAVLAKNIKKAITGENGSNQNTNQDNHTKTVEEKVQEKLKSMTLDEKVSQMFMVMTSSGSELKQNAGGYVLNWSNFDDVESAITSAKTANKIPAIYATDDEGGKVTRVATGFASAQSYGKTKNYTKLAQDEQKKAKVLLSKGINLNLAPVADLSKDNSYMGLYERSFGADLKVTTKCVETVVKEAKDAGLSTCLKHFPGYGNNKNTHTGIVTDTRTYDTLKKKDLQVFQAGIQAGAPTILVGHNIMQKIDNKLPASLSPDVHKIIRDYLQFDGVVMTDDLGMDAIGNNYSDIAVKAVIAGNDMVMTNQFENSKKEILDAVSKGTITESRIDESVKRILTWKYEYNIIAEDSESSESNASASLQLGVKGNNTFQGNIRIKRVTPNKARGEAKVADGKIQTLSFVEEATFDDLVNQNSEKALDVYTLNKNMQLITATWSYNSDSGLRITKGESIHYSSIMEKYTMPFDYLLCFLVDGEDIQFAEDLAQLALDSEIVIAVQDAVTTTVSSRNRVDENGKVILAPNGLPMTETVIYESVSSAIELTYADTWFVKMEKEQSYSSQNSNIVSEGSSNGSEIINQYTSGQFHKPEGKEKEFIDLFRNSENAINSVEVSWLYELLEQRPKTKNMIELTKYLFSCVRNESNIGTFDFSIYEDNKFATIGSSSGTYGGTIQEKVWWALKDMNFSDYAIAGAMGNIHYESGSFNPNAVEGGYAFDVAGIGLCQWTNYPRNAEDGRHTKLIEFAKSRGKEWNDEDIQVEYLVGELTVGGGADGKASYQLMSNHGYSPDQWINANNVEEATRAFCWTFERPRVSDGESSLPQRIQKAEEYYHQFHDKGKPSGGGTASKTGWSTTGLSCPRYYQSDAKWGANSYPYKPGGTISSGGCGACALAMAVSRIIRRKYYTRYYCEFFKC